MTAISGDFQDTDSASIVTRNGRGTYSETVIFRDLISAAEVRAAGA
jgi:hypothetical protein